MKIYDVENHPNPLQARIALAEKKPTDKEELVAIDLLNGEYCSEAFLAKNP